jgi:hypothetical protein
MKAQNCLPELKFAMKTKLLVILALTGLSTLNPQLSAAPMGTAFNYQGRLAVGTNAANGSYDLKFTLYDAEAGTGLVGGPLTNAAVAVSNGLFAVTLDFGPAAFTGEARWLEIGVRTNGSGAFVPLAPRQALNPSPYALFASDAATLGGQAPSYYAPASGSTAYVAKSGDTMTGTLNLPANGLVAGAGQFVLSGDKVGIGTATPSATLHVAVPGSANPIEALNVDVASFTTDPNATASHFLRIRDVGAGDVKFIVKGSGNVGIGTGTPQSQLHVANSVGVARIRSETLAANAGGVVEIAAPGGQGELIFGGTTYPSWGGPLSLNLVNVAEGPLTFGHYFGGSGFERMRITSSGNVGIGTANPTAMLDVAGTVKATGLDVGGDLNIRGTSGGLGIGSIPGYYSDFYYNLYYGGSPATWRNTAQGSGMLLKMYGGANYTSAFSVQVSPLATSAPAGSDAGLFEALRVINNGNVGIGTTTPAAKLDVVGTVSAENVTLTGNLNLPATTATAGIINLGDNRLLHAYGSGNLFAGRGAGNFTMSGHGNTASGADTLAFNTSGGLNTAHGYAALKYNLTGDFNTALGQGALWSNTAGDDNTALGSATLFSNTTGTNNTASGSGALYSNQTGHDNTANGYQTLYYNRVGNYNTALGKGSLYSNTSGDANTALGQSALYSNTSGDGNIALGEAALSANSSGHYNIAVGRSALVDNVNGEYNTAIGCYSLEGLQNGTNNIAIGTYAGWDLGYANPTGGARDNIYIGSLGDPNDNYTIRIGSGAAQTYISGIRGRLASGGTAVYIDPYGKLGTLISSRRFKEAIEDMGGRSEVLLSLRPVSFRYKAEMDPQGMPQFGLIAEEVEQVAPELVLRDAQGEIYSVRYEQVNAMLLNEFLKQHRKVEAQDTKIQALEQSVAELKSLVSALVEKSNGGGQ